MLAFGRWDSEIIFITKSGSCGVGDVTNAREPVILIFEYSLLIVVWAGVLVSVYYSLVTGISPIPSSRISTNHIMEILPENLVGDIIELGAGWGTLAFPLAALFPGNRVLAYELSPVPWLFMKLRHLAQQSKNLTIIRSDFHKASLKGVGIVVAYLHSEGLAKIREKMERELAPGTLVVSNTFEIPGWTYEACHQLDDSFCPQVYLYRVPGVGIKRDRGNVIVSK